MFSLFRKLPENFAGGWVPVGSESLYGDLFDVHRLSNSHQFKKNPKSAKTVAQFSDWAINQSAPCKFWKRQIPANHNATWRISKHKFLEIVKRNKNREMAARNWSKYFYHNNANYKWMIKNGIWRKSELRVNFNIIKKSKN